MSLFTVCLSPQDAPYFHGMYLYNMNFRGVFLYYSLKVDLGKLLLEGLVSKMTIEVSTGGKILLLNVTVENLFPKLAKILMMWCIYKEITTVKLDTRFS